MFKSLSSGIHLLIFVEVSNLAQMVDYLLFVGDQLNVTRTMQKLPLDFQDTFEYQFEV